MPKKLSKIFLVEDHPLFRQGLAVLVDRQEGIRVCGEAETAAAALEGIEKTKPDVAIVDLSLKGGLGLDLIRNIRANHPQTAVLVLSMHDERRYGERCIRAGARGYVMKSEAPSTVIDALRQITEGRPYLSQQMRALAVERFLSGAPAADTLPEEVLSGRELEVFGLLGRGNDTRQVAERLGISFKTVQAFCANIKQKLHLANATELMREAVRWTEEANVLE